MNGSRSTLSRGAPASTPALRRGRIGRHASSLRPGSCARRTPVSNSRTSALVVGQPSAVVSPGTATRQPDLVEHHRPPPCESDSSRRNCTMASPLLRAQPGHICRCALAAAIDQAALPVARHAVVGHQPQGSRYWICRSACVATKKCPCPAGAPAGSRQASSSMALHRALADLEARQPVPELAGDRLARLPLAGLQFAQ